MNEYKQKYSSLRLYNKEDFEFMKISQNALRHRESRVSEIIAYAREAGYKRLGIAYCHIYKNQVKKLIEIFSDEFETFSIHCKNEDIPKSVMLGDGVRGVSCNPNGQADFLNKNKTELNITFGLCIGHDILFGKKSNAPVTNLVVKERLYSRDFLDLIEKSLSFGGDIDEK